MTRDDYDAQLRRLRDLLRDDDELPVELQTGLDVEAVTGRALEIIRRHRSRRLAEPSWWERLRNWLTPVRMSFAFNGFLVVLILAGAACASSSPRCSRTTSMGRPGTFSAGTNSNPVSPMRLSTGT